MRIGIRRETEEMGSCVEGRDGRLTRSEADAFLATSVPDAPCLAVQPSIVK